MKKKLFSILVSLMMVLTMMPFMAVVSNAATAPKPLCFTAETANSTVKFVENYDYGNTVSLLYSLDGVNWESYEIGNSIMLSNIKDTVFFKANGENTCFHGFRFDMTGRVAASGNIMSLLNGSIALAEIPSKDCFTSIFSSCESLTTPPELPATTLKDWCYYNMFYNCKNLRTAPGLPATNLEDYCYYSMFYGCASLTQAPKLNATNLDNYCYGDMFRNCTRLETAPVLPATTLADHCYYEMFMGCTSLKHTPELPATKLAGSCYLYMFYACTGLTELPELPATELPRNCYSYMFDECKQFNLIELDSIACYKTFRIPSEGAGVEERAGSSCFKMVNTKTPKLGVIYSYMPNHENIGKFKAKESTCDVPGYKAFYYCDGCKLYFSDENGENLIPDITAWKKGEGKIATKPHTLKKEKGSYVCTGTGWKDYYKCTVCKKKFSDSDGKKEITDFTAWKTGDGKLVNPGHIVNAWTAGTAYHYGECVYCREIVSVNHIGSPCEVCGYVAGEVQEPEDDEEVILDEEETTDENGVVEGEESDNPQDVSSIFSNGVLWIVLVIGLAAIAGIAVVATKKNKE